MKHPRLVLKFNASSPTEHFTNGLQMLDLSYDAGPYPLSQSNSDQAAAPHSAPAADQQSKMFFDSSHLPKSDAHPTKDLSQAQLMKFETATDQDPKIFLDPSNLPNSASATSDITLAELKKKFQTRKPNQVVEKANRKRDSIYREDFKRQLEQLILMIPTTTTLMLTSSGWSNRRTVIKETIKYIEELVLRNTLLENSLAAQPDQKDSHPSNLRETLVNAIKKGKTSSLLDTNLNRRHGATIDRIRMKIACVEENKRRMSAKIGPDDTKEHSASQLPSIRNALDTSDERITSMSALFQFEDPKLEHKQTSGNMHSFAHSNDSIGNMLGHLRGTESHMNLYDLIF